MNIHINRLVNNKLDNSEIRINIEYAEKNEDIKNLINHIQEYDKRKMVVFDGYNMKVSYMKLKKKVMIFYEFQKVVL